MKIGYVVNVDTKKGGLAMVILGKKRREIVLDKAQCQLYVKLLTPMIKTLLEKK